MFEHIKPRRDGEIGRINRIQTEESVNQVLDIYEDLSEDKKDKVRKQVMDEYDKEIVSFRSIVQRIVYLVEKEEYKLNEEDLEKYLKNGLYPCPYCNTPISIYSEECSNCGCIMPKDFPGIESLEYMEDAEEKFDKIEEIISTTPSIKYPKNDAPEEYIKKQTLESVIIKILLDINVHMFEGFDEYTNILSSKEIKDELIKRGLIEFNYGDYAEFLNLNYNISELKNILKEHNLKNSGKKIKLIKRIMENIPQTEFDISDVELSIKGLEYIDNDLIWDYNNYLYDFYFDEFKTYYDNSKEKDTSKVILNFLNEIEEKHPKDFKFLISIYESKYGIYSTFNEDKSLEAFVYCFLLNLNMLHLTEEVYSVYPLFDSLDIKSLHNFEISYKKDEIIKTFEEIWNNLQKDLIIPKKDTMEIITKLLEGEESDLLEFEIKEKYFIN